MSDQADNRKYHESKAPTRGGDDGADDRRENCAAERGTAQRQRHGETALQVKPVRDNNRDEQARAGGDDGARKRSEQINMPGSARNRIPEEHHRRKSRNANRDSASIDFIEQEADDERATIEISDASDVPVLYSPIVMPKSPTICA